jgi:type IV secretory pathway protease TraF
VVQVAYEGGGGYAPRFDASISGPERRQDSTGVSTILFNNVAAGEYSITVSPRGGDEGALLQERFLRQVVTAGGHHTVTFVIARMGELRIQVRDSRVVSYIGNAQVTVTGPSGFEMVSQTGVEWHARRVRVGVYSASVTVPPGYRVVADQNGHVARDATRDLVFLVDRLTWVKLKAVDDASGDPMEGVEMHVQVPGAPAPVWHRTDAQGEIRVEFLYHDAGNCEVLEVKLADPDHRDVAAVNSA